MSILQDSIPGARVLDLFAGSGALGLEALSRGASFVEFSEMSTGSLTALRANIEALGVESQIRVHRGDAMKLAEKLPPAAFDVVMADPPYTIDYAGRLVA